MSATGGTAVNAMNVTALSQSRSTVVSVPAHAVHFSAAARALLEPGWQ